nr:immunoglobulin heavy chain junction region [Macaca mulatta]MOX00217.1 immunoglobulin heavy chain junction region [Macaca mulatta]MOX01175.1 immunoglobulin heavy chain junction region [Macaca mulatta]MOX01840.1 immunoglobulin heavy chain junction region [Macaca mulatta]MOX02385.1 immunoglobulin heavy chain junction region [Macaca mulatta]
CAREPPYYYDFAYLDLW